MDERKIPNLEGAGSNPAGDSISNRRSREFLMKFIRLVEQILTKKGKENMNVVNALEPFNKLW